MSANIAIAEGGKGHPFGPVKCLMVEKDDGKFYPWFPEADRALDSLSVTQNGIYQAKDYGVYGWNRVSVNVPNSDGVTGRDPETKEEVYVTKDPETGELVEKAMATYIVIDTPPNQLSYFEGRAINYSGMIVKAYLNTGNLWTDDSHPDGIIFNSELSLPVQTADSSALEPGGGEAISSLDTALDQPIPFGTSGYTLQEINGNRYDYSISGTSTVKVIRLVRTDGGTAPYFMSDANFTVTERTYNASGELIRTQTYSPTRRTLYGYDGYVLSIPGTPVSRILAVGTVNIKTNANMTDADYYTIIYGTIINGYKIPVRWSRGDGKALETSFSINILPNGAD